MKKIQLLWQVIFFAGFLCAPAMAVSVQDLMPDTLIKVTSFDVSDLPARLDEPRLQKDGDKFVLNCTIANREGEQLLGLRLIALIVDRSGKLRGRLTWSESTELAGYSIKAFRFHPVIKDEIRTTDYIFLGIEEVIGRETIWQTVAAEKALRAYSRGQHDVTPKVRTVANKFDRPTNPIVPIMRQRLPR